MAVALDLHVLADGHGAGPRDPPEVVAPEVDEHDVLGSLLRVALELLGEEPRPPRASAPRGRVPAIGWVVSLSPSTWRSSSGRRADDLERRRPDEEEVRARVDPAKRAVEADPVERSCRSPGPPAGRTTGAGRGRPGSPRRPRSRPWRPRPRGCTRRGRGSSRSRWPAAARRRRAVGAAAGCRRRDLGGARAGRPFERLEDRRLGDPVAALEVGRLGVERGDRRQRVGQVVEDEDEVGLDEGGQSARRPGRAPAAGRSARRLETAS